MDDRQTEGELCLPSVRRAPLVPVALALIAGIVVGRFLPIAPLFWAILALTGLGTAAVLLFRRDLHLLSAVFVCLSVGCVGAIQAGTSHRTVPRGHVAGFVGDRPVLLTLQGQVVTTPTVSQPADREHLGWRGNPTTSLLVQARRVHDRRGWHDTNGLVKVSINAEYTPLRAGHHVELIGKAGRFGPADNPGQYDPASTARRRGVLVWLQVPCGQGAKVLDSQDVAPLERALWNARSSVRQPLVGPSSPHESRIVAALVIGERHPALRATNRVMMRAGVAHFLSISGLHLAVFLGFVYLLARLGRLGPRAAAGAVLSILVVYLLIAEPRAPLLRSALMAGLICIAALLHRRYVALNAVAMAAIVLLLVQPLQLFEAGFQLSFVIVTGLILLYKPAEQILFGRFLRHRGLMVFRRDERLRRWAYYSLANTAIGMATMGLLAYVCAAPLVAYHFGIFSPYGAVLSLLMFPLVLAVLIPSYLAMALAWPMPNLSGMLSRLAETLAGWLGGMIDALRHLPGLSIPLHPLNLGWLVLAYGTIVAWILSPRIRAGRCLAAGVTACLAVATAWSQWPASCADGAELHLADVGSGQCALLHLPAGSSLMIDAGTSRPVDVTRTTIQPLVHHLRLPTPSACVISHGNTDHYNALPTLIRQGDVSLVYASPYLSRTNPEDRSERRLLTLLKAEGVAVTTLARGDHVQLDERTKLEILWPPRPGIRDLTAEGFSPNDRALVVRVVCDESSILLPSDLTEIGQRELLNSGANLRADVLVLPHHGSWRPTLREFVEAVDPRVVLVSSSRDLRISDPRAKEFLRWLTRNRAYYSTASNGWIRTRLTHSGPGVRTMR